MQPDSPDGVAAAATMPAVTVQASPHWLVCPDCTSTLRIDRQAAACTACGRSWPHRSNLLCFVEGDYYWGEISRDQMHEILQVIDTAGWQAAVDHIRTHYPNENVVAFAPERGAWLSLLDPPSWDLALDVGAGYGGIARWMGEAFREVVGLEANVERTMFASHLYRAAGVTNVWPLLANMHRPPLRESAFDVVALTGVLEWAAMFGEHSDALEAQLELLGKCWRLLKRGGQLYVAIENRFAPLYLLGWRDHGRLPWAGLLPYRLSRHVVRLLQGWERQPLTHSQTGLISLLHRAGFIDVHVHYPLPGYHRPMIIAESEDCLGPAWFLSQFKVPSAVANMGHMAAGCWKFMQRFSRAWPLMRPLVPALIVVGRKRQA